MATCMEDSTTGKRMAELFELLRSLPEVWQTKNPKYTNHLLKDEAYQKLLVKYREMEPEANVDNLKKKIQSYRSCFRREFRKVKESMRSGIGAADVYKPVLWYYKHLEFLLEQEEEVKMEAIDSENIEAEQELQLIEGKLRTPKKRSKEDLLQTAVELLEQIKSKPKEDNVDYIAGYWSAQYKELPATQKLYCKQVISEAFFYGALGHLTPNTYKYFGAYLNNEPLNLANENLSQYQNSEKLLKSEHHSSQHFGDDGIEYLEDSDSNSSSLKPYVKLEKELQESHDQPSPSGCMETYDNNSVIN